MCFRTRRATMSRRLRRPPCQAPTVQPLALLDLSKPGERQSHDFLLRATTGSDRMWELLDLRRLGDVLLCVVRWVHPDNSDKPFSLAEVSLAATAVCWQDFASMDGALTEIQRRCDVGGST